jgi:Zn-finger nucleic acid-binding protein
MLRLNYQGKSGVIIDRCKEHGYWLDSGELRQIMEWAKLEGIHDFTPVVHQQQNNTSIASGTSRVAASSAEVEFDPIVSFFRKLYGF